MVTLTNRMEEVEKEISKIDILSKLKKKKDEIKEKNSEAIIDYGLLLKELIEGDN